MNASRHLLLCSNGPSLLEACAFVGKISHTPRPHPTAPTPAPHLIAPTARPIAGRWRTSSAARVSTRSASSTSMETRSRRSPPRTASAASPAKPRRAAVLHPPLRRHRRPRTPLAPLAGLRGLTGLSGLMVLTRRTLDCARSWSSGTTSDTCCGRRTCTWSTQMASHRSIRSSCACTRLS